MDDHRREVDRARRQERKKRSEGKGEIRLARAVATGKQTKDADEDRVKLALSNWINELRSIFEGSMIRRTVNSLDYRGQPISGLEKWTELPILIELSPEEMHVQELLAEGLVGEGAKATVKAVQVSTDSLQARGRHSWSDAPRPGGGEGTLGPAIAGRTHVPSLPVCASYGALERTPRPSLLE